MDIVNLTEMMNVDDKV